MFFIDNGLKREFYDMVIIMIKIIEFNHLSDFVFIKYFLTKASKMFWKV